MNPDAVFIGASVEYYKRYLRYPRIVFCSHDLLHALRRQMQSMITVKNEVTWVDPDESIKFRGMMLSPKPEMRGFSLVTFHPEIEDKIQEP